MHSGLTTGSAQVRYTAGHCVYHPGAACAASAALLLHIASPSQCRNVYAELGAQDAAIDTVAQARTSTGSSSESRTEHFYHNPDLAGWGLIMLIGPSGPPLTEWHNVSAAA